MKRNRKKYLKKRTKFIFCRLNRRKDSDKLNGSAIWNKKIATKSIYLVQNDKDSDKLKIYIQMVAAFREKTPEKAD